jgi:Fe2+ transport system protein FeoA
MDKLSIVPNAECIIESGKGANAIPQRLIQMGVLPGSKLRIVRVGPMGGTVEVVIDEAGSIALRTEELQLLHCKISAIPLVNYKALHNSAYKIRELRGGQLFVRKMKLRGIKEGSIITKIKEKEGLLITVKRKGEMRIGYGEAEKVIIEPFHNG